MPRERLKRDGRDLLDECFGNLNGGANNQYLGRYWNELFRRELEHVKQQAEQDLLKKIPANPIMIMTLGASLEPLILAIHLVRPEQLFVLYTSSALMDRLEGGLRNTGFVDLNDRSSGLRLKPENGLPDTDFVIALKGIDIEPNASSASVFKTLRGKGETSEQNPNLAALMAILNDSQQRGQIVFDITGAKKTISGGCLLFAAYYDIPVYYMDFGDEPGDYHPDLGRPLPGTCYYTRQKNPIAGFCLKDIEGIKKHFDKGNYAIAAELLKKMKKTVNQKMDPEYFSQGEICHYHDLYEKARIYNDWVNGWWGDVYQKLSSLPPANQTHVRLLSAYPSKTGWKQPKYQIDFYKKTDEFLAYLVMELATLSRALKNGTMHPRTVFLRIYGLEEMLVGFMTYKLWVKRLVKICPDQPDTDIRDAFDAPQYYYIEKLLIKTNNVKVHSKGKEFSLGRVKSVSLSSDIETQLKEFNKYENRNLRNKATHSIAAVKKATAENIRNAFEELLKLLLEDTSIKWFQNTDNLERNTDNLERIKKLLNRENWRENWFENPTVAPLKWDALQ